MNILLFIMVLFFSTNLHAEVLDRIVAVVDTQNMLEKTVKPLIITQSEVDEVVHPLLRRLERSGEKIDREKIKKRALEELVLRALRTQKASQLGIVVEDKDVQGLMGQIEKDNRLPFGSLPQALAAQGIDLEIYKLGLKDKLLQSRLVSRVIRPIVNVSEEEIQALYETISNKPLFEEIRLGQILLPLEKKTSAIHVARIRYEAGKLAEKLRQGASLETLAGQFSEDSSGLSGGDMGWFKRGELLPQLEKLVFDLDKGAISDPIRSAQGFHVFKMLDKRSRNKVIKEKAKVKARHILIKVAKNASERESAAALSKIKKIQQRLNAGAAFSEMAKKYSQDASAADGGDLGWFSEGLMVPVFEEAAFSLGIGETSGPVRTPFGWHLIHIDEKEFLNPTSLEAQRKELTERVAEAKTKALYDQWLRDLRQRSFVEFR